MVPAMEPFGWTTFSAIVGKQTSNIVSTMAGALTVVDTLKMFQFYALQYGWWEAEMHKKDYWK